MPPKKKGDNVVDFERITSDTEEAQPKDVFKVPADEVFAEAGSEYLEAPELEAIGKALIDGDFELGALVNREVLYFWKHTSGTSRGKGIMGRLEVPGQLFRKYKPASYVLWISADRVRKENYTPMQMQAQVYHLLLHAEIKMNGKAGLTGPTILAFPEEIEKFGAWQNDLRKGERAMDASRQLTFEDAAVAASR